MNVRLGCQTALTRTPRPPYARFTVSSSPTAETRQRCRSFPSGTAPSETVRRFPSVVIGRELLGVAVRPIGFFRQQGGNSIRKDEGRGGWQWYVRAKNTVRPAKPDVMQQQEELWRGGGASGVVVVGLGRGR